MGQATYLYKRITHNASLQNKTPMGALLDSLAVTGQTETG